MSGLPRPPLIRIVGMSGLPRPQGFTLAFGICGATPMARRASFPDLLSRQQLLLGRGRYGRPSVRARLDAQPAVQVSPEGHAPPRPTPVGRRDRRFHPSSTCGAGRTALAGLGGSQAPRRRLPGDGMSRCRSCTVLGSMSCRRNSGPAASPSSASIPTPRIRSATSPLSSASMKSLFRSTKTSTARLWRLWVRCAHPRPSFSTDGAYHPLLGLRIDDQYGVGVRRPAPTQRNLADAL